MLPPTVSSVQRFSPCIWDAIVWHDMMYHIIRQSLHPNACDSLYVF